jgi:hypothetical protein
LPEADASMPPPKSGFAAIRALPSVTAPGDPPVPSWQPLPLRSLPRPLRNISSLLAGLTVDVALACWLNAAVQLTRIFTPDQYAKATEPWAWLGLAGKTPIFASAFGDIFFTAADGFWFLDTVEGTLTRPWRTADELNAALNSADGQDMYLLSTLAAEAERAGLIAGPNQVYDFKITPALGGPIDVSNIGVIDFVVGVNITGQLHEQLRGVPPGTKIAGVTIGGDGRVRISM